MCVQQRHFARCLSEENLCHKLPTCVFSILALEFIVIDLKDYNFKQLQSCVSLLSSKLHTVVKHEFSSKKCSVKLNIWTENWVLLQCDKATIQVAKKVRNNLRVEIKDPPAF